MARESSGNKEVAPPKKKRSAKSIAFRTAVRLLVAGFLLLLLGVPFLYAPLSSTWLDQLLKEKWYESTGLRLNFDRAQWTFGRGHASISFPTIYDPTTLEPLIDLTSFEVEVDVWSLLRAAVTTRKEFRIKRLSALGPLEIRFEERNGRLRPAPQFERAYRIARIHLEAQKSDLRAQVDRIQIERVNFRVDHMSSEGRKPALAIWDTSFLADFHGPSIPPDLHILGRLRGRGGAADFRVQFNPRLDNDEIAVEIHFNPIDSSEHMMADLPLDFRTSKLTARGNLRKLPNGNWALYTETILASLTLVGAGVHGLDQEIEDAKLYTDIEWDVGRDGLNFTQVQFESKDCNFEASGALALSRPYFYGLNLHPFELRGQGLALLERNLFGEHHISKPDEGAFVISGEVAGRLEDWTLDDLRGDVLLTDVTFELPTFPEPVHIVKVDAALTTRTVTLNEGLGVIAGIPFQLTGRLTGEPLKGEIAFAEIGWQVAGEVEGLSDALARSEDGADLGLRFKGDVSGSGVLTCEYPELTDWAVMLDRAEVQGRLEFNDAEVKLRRFEKPIRNLRGSVILNRREATLRKLSGTIEDVEFDLDGKVFGDENFWTDSQTTGSAQARLNLDKIPDYLEWLRIDEPENMPKAEGRAIVSADFYGPLDDWRSMWISGNVSLESVVSTLEAPGGPAHLRAPSIEAEFDPSELRFVIAGAIFNGIEIDIDGVIHPNDGAVTVNTDGPLPAYRVIAPVPLKSLEDLGGNLIVQQQIRLQRVARESRPADNLIELIFPSGRQDQKEPLNLAAEWDYDFEGDLSMNNVTLLHKSAPESGRLTEIYGGLHFTATEFRSLTPVQLKVGANGEDLSVTALMTFQENPPNMNFDFKLTGRFLDLDDWLKAWRKPDKRQATLLANDQFRSRLHIEVAVDEMHYRGVRGRNLTGDVTFETRGPGNWVLAWTDAQVFSDSGRLKVSGEWKKEEGRAIEEYRGETERFDVSDLLFAAYQRRNEGGISSGVVTGDFAIRRTGLQTAKGRPFEGGGHLLIEDSQFTSNAIFSNLGGLLNLEELFDDISFSRVEGDFTVGQGAVHCDELSFDHPSPVYPLNLVASGSFGPGREIDMALRLQLFPIVESIPVVGGIWDVFNSLTGRLLNFQVGNTLDDPKIGPPKIVP